MRKQPDAEATAGHGHDCDKARGFGFSALEKAKGTYLIDCDGLLSCAQELLLQAPDLPATGARLERDLWFYGFAEAVLGKPLARAVSDATAEAAGLRERLAAVEGERDAARDAQVGLEDEATVLLARALRAERELATVTRALRILHQEARQELHDGKPQALLQACRNARAALEAKP